MRVGVSNDGEEMLMIVLGRDNEKESWVGLTPLAYHARSAQHSVPVAVKEPLVATNYSSLCAIRGLSSSLLLRTLLSKRSH